LKIQFQFLKNNLYACRKYFNARRLPQITEKTSGMLKIDRKDILVPQDSEESYHMAHMIWESPDFQNFHIFDKGQLASNESRFRIDSVLFFYKIRRRPEF
jgi:hypothetical protein